MEQNKVRIKIGDHEFEAEGPPEIVQAQLAAFQELLANPQIRTKRTETSAQQTPNEPTQRAVPNGPPAFDEIIKVEGRVVSLTARTSSLEDALMLMILGQKTLRNNDAITGAELVDGLKRSGQWSGQSTQRRHRTLEKIASEGNIIITGVHRGKRYGLTIQGVTRAQQIARCVIDMVAESYTAVA